MSKIHYFQRYSSAENTVTNNTLQLIARIYNYSTTKASKFLSELTGESIDIGIEIQQQTGGRSSIPDGSIVQNSFKVLIESKVGSGTNIPQLLNHAKGFDDEAQKILLLLAKQELPENEAAEIQKNIREQSGNVLFKSVTYEGVCNALKGLFQEYEDEMNALVDDYTEYCNDTGLFDQSKYLMRIVPCGDTLAINKKFGLYYDKKANGYTPHSYVGIYKNKTVQSIWKIENIYDADLIDGELIKTLIHGPDTTKYDAKLKGMIEESVHDYGYQVSQDHRFFCGDAVETHFVKDSYGGIQGKRFVNLKDVIGEFESTEEAAEKLREKTWT